MAQSQAELVKGLVDAGVHFGHRVSRWNPKMEPYIHGKRNMIHIIDVKETVKGLLRAKRLVQQTVASGRDRLLDETLGKQEALDGLLHIDDVNHVALAVDVRLHLRVPTRNAVAEVNAGVDECFNEFCLRLSHEKLIADFQFAICD